MAYNVVERFPPPPKSYRLLEPGAYQTGFDDRKVRMNKFPFLSRTPRKTQPGGQLWTHAIYDSVIPAKVPNITSMTSKRPRFPYEAFSKEDLEALLCRCGIQSPCECPTEEEQEPEVLCQGKVPKRIFKGPTPRATQGEGLSTPSKRDRGFEILPNGSQKRLLEKVVDESPPFYNTQVYESTAFYHGCKWSKWRSKRSSQTINDGPGPAEYFYVKHPTDFEICAEKVRLYRRQTSKQLRFIEMVQQRDINEGRPGPATYSPKLLSGYELQYLGPKSKRFTTSTIEQRPGPADHSVKRAFDLPEPPDKPCHAKLPEPSFFGIKAQRFKPRREEGPSPATYNPVYSPCHFMHCPTTPFGSSTARFKENPVTEEEEAEEIAVDEPEKGNSNVHTEKCPVPTWEFKSKSIRMKPLEKVLNEPSPADLPQPRIKVGRPRALQYYAPFFSSEGRFHPWNDWMPVHGKEKTPGPCYYCLEKPKCYPAVPRGPLFRSPRFQCDKNNTPPPNQYKVSPGIETILDTHNQRLKDNIENQHKFIWEMPAEPRRLSFEEQETLLLQKSIALLDTDIFDDKTSKSGSGKSSPRLEKPKLLRCFLYGSQTPHCI